MSTAQNPEQATPVVDPPTTQPPTTIAAEPTPDAVKPLATQSSTAESRPEGAAAVDTATTDAAPVTASTETEAEKPSKKEAVVESQPINEGVLDHRGPGLVNLVKGASKRYFWFSEEPVESKLLSEYVRGEKPDTATVHHNAAHASQTGKGLLFYAKRAEDKGHPVGILNLSDAKELTKGDVNDFSLKIHGQKHGFQAPTKAERDGWLVAIETRSVEAKAAFEDLIASEGYKSYLEKLTKPAAPNALAAGASRSASRPKKSLDGSKVHDGTLPTDNVAVAGPAVGVAAVGASAVGGSSSDDDRAKGKSRSQSRKRGSIFGALLHKKEEHDEKKEIKKEKKEVQEEDKAEKEEDKPVEAEGSTAAEPAPLDPVAVASRVLAEPVVPSEDIKPVIAQEVTETNAVEPSAASPTREAAPKPSKRNSRFGFFGKKDSAATGAKDTAPATAAKDSETTPVSATAPQLDDPVTSASPEPTATSPVAADGAEIAAPVNGPTATATTPDAAKENKRRTSFFGNLGTRKEKKTDTTSDGEIADGEGKKPTPAIFGMFRKPSRRAPSGSRAPNNTEITPPALPEPTKTSAVVSKETPAIADDAAAKSSTRAVDEPSAAVSTGHSQPTPVPATA